jgi:putative DNA primase/helicase
MASREQVLAQMAADLPPLPPGHPRLNGKVNRFGKGKKAWYQLREFTLRSGRGVVTGAYGVWQGQNPNAVPIKIDWEGASEEDRAEAARRQAEIEREESERRANAARFAANRAGQDWKRASTIDDLAGVPYLVRKQIGGEFARLAADGILLVPARRYRAGQRPELVCLQKIDQAGEKRFNAGADMVGAACLLGTITRGETTLIGIAEGYATGQSVRLAEGGTLPVMVAFNAGNLPAVARQLRTDFPEATLLLFADDDWQLVQRYMRDLVEEFDVDTAPPIDGTDHVVTNGKGESVTVRATWRQDATGTDYIECDIRAGRRVRMLKFENAGIAKARAAAADVGNAHVCWPRFAARGENKWTDFNDLHVEESIDAARAQVRAAIAAATVATADAPEEALEPMPAEPDAAAQALSPAPPGPAEPVELVDMRVPTIEALLSHFALIYPTTDVWDGLRKQRMKKGSFTAWVGKELAHQWEKSTSRRTILRDSLPTLIGGKAVGTSGEGGKLGEMLEHLTLLRGTETVWDGIGQQVMSLGAVRADYTADITARWQEHSQRKTIEARNLVFDPTQVADPVTHVNIFLGWPLVPKEGAQLVDPILALLESLCSAEDKVGECVDWILRWLAYPLQHPGAKMQTALLMFGEKQGTGKSLFFQDVMAPIYGDYGTVASQHQLESSFTAWRSRKLFVLFEEVLSRDDKYSHNGTLKYMVTGKQMSINQKNLPERTERNHMNAVFLSNEPQPIPIELEDRRFMVIEARKKQAAEFYARVKASIDAGGLEAFYHFLLNFPLADFDEHTKPPMTLAKERVIEFGLSGWMSFHRAWKDGYLDAPHCTCLSEDLYKIYKRWCDKSGEKPLSLTKFSGLVGSREHKVKRKVSVDKKQPKDRMVFEISAPDEKDSRDVQIERFRKLGDVRSDSALG